MKKRKSKMDCRDCREKIDKYLEGKLGKSEEASFEDHLQTCPECLEILQMQELADRIISEEKKAEPGFFLTDKIMAGIGNLEKEPDPLLIRLLRPALAAIAVAAAIMAGVLIGNIPDAPAGNGVPIELTLINDSELELVNVLTSE